MARVQPPQIAPRVFPEPQQRAINDALGRLPSLDTPRVHTPKVNDGQSTFQIAVNENSSNYTVTVEMTWFAQWRTRAKTSRLLTLEMSNGASAGDVLRVELS